MGRQPVHVHRQADLGFLVEAIANAPKIGDLTHHDPFRKDASRPAGHDDLAGDQLAVPRQIAQVHERMIQGTGGCRRDDSLITALVITHQDGDAAIRIADHDHLGLGKADAGHAAHQSFRRDVEFFLAITLLRFLPPIPALIVLTFAVCYLGGYAQ